MNARKKLANIPAPAGEAIAIHVTAPAERELRKGSPWLYEASITSQNRPGNPGDTAVVFDKNNRFLAVGLLDPSSYIRVRILAANTPQKIDSAWFRQSFHKALALRKSLQPQSNGYRVIHGENDGFSGLVIDRYADVFVIKLYSLAWVPHLRTWCEILAKETGALSVVLRLSRKVQSQKHQLYELEDGDVICGKDIQPPIDFKENKFSFMVDPLHGHKTGFYLDQRENRMHTMEFTIDARVLNVFSYSGGFSVYAAAGGATAVTSIDQNPHALADAQRIFNRNRSRYPHQDCSHKTILKDAFEAMKKLIDENKSYDVIIIDPPSFARRSEQVEAAIAAYQVLARYATLLVNDNGIIIQSSCSSKVSKDEFFDAVISAARENASSIQVVMQTGHPLDHPVVIETSEYLKCIYYRVSK